MKKYILLFLVLNFYYSNSQIKSGVVTYGVVVTENKESNLEKMMLSMNANYYSITKEFDFQLKFNKEKALFVKVEKLYSDDQAAKIGSVKIGFTGNYLIKKDTVFKEGTSFGIGDYIVKKPMIKNWTLLNETKLIDKYVCYKATTENVVSNSNNTFRHPIIAWYCPEIPFSFGPIGYGGLPGLILELQTKDAVFGVKEMQMSTNNCEIKELKKYRIFEEEELNVLIEKKNSND